jgi:hypothetical protein
MSDASFFIGECQGQARVKGNQMFYFTALVAIKQFHTCVSATTCNYIQVIFSGKI